MTFYKSCQFSRFCCPVSVNSVFNSISTTRYNYIRPSSNATSTARRISQVNSRANNSWTSSSSIIKLRNICNGSFSRNKVLRLVYSQSQFLQYGRRDLLYLKVTVFVQINSKYYSTSSTSTSRMADKKKVCIVGSGNWGSAIAKIIGANVVNYPDIFDQEVKIYVFEELVNGRKLTEIINQDHENLKYLPGHKLPTNIVADPDVVSTASDADIVLFVLPHQFIKNTCKPLIGKMKPGAVGLSLIKGFDTAPGGGIELISHIITKLLNIPCNVLMGANLAHEIAEGKFSETTIGSHDKAQGAILHKLIQTEDFRVVVVDDVDTVELCGALKNIVGVGAGFIDGLELGDNTKAAVIRLGLMEMVRFAEMFYKCKLSTFLESCGVADLITTCYGGRNRKIAEAFVRTGKKLEELEKEMLNGQRLQGPHTAEEVNFMLKSRGIEDKFPLFTGVHKICTGQLPPKAIIDCIRSHPEHIVRDAGD